MTVLAAITLSNVIGAGLMQSAAPVIPLMEPAGAASVTPGNQNGVSLREEVVIDYVRHGLPVIFDITPDNRGTLKERLSGMFAGPAEWSGFEKALSKSMLLDIAAEKDLSVSLKAGAPRVISRTTNGIGTETWVVSGPALILYRTKERTGYEMKAIITTTIVSGTGDNADRPMMASVFVANAEDTK